MRGRQYSSKNKAREVVYNESRSREGPMDELNRSGGEEGLEAGENPRMFIKRSYSLDDTPNCDFIRAI